MLVILMKDQLLQPSTVCHSCPMANQSGLPRWTRGHLGCGRLVEAESDASESNACNGTGLTEYECTMGFRLAKLAD